MDKLGYQQQTKLHDNGGRRSFPIHRNIFWTRSHKSYNNKSHDHHRKCHKHNQYIFKLISICLLGTASPAFATDVGGVSATANPIANSSGSVTNQAIQVLQGPYITNTYGNGIQCQGPTMNVTPYFTGNGSFRRPFEHTYQDPVYNNVDADDDGVPDNPGEILYYIPTRTGQQETYNLSAGVSATWSKPLDKKLQEQCKQAAAANINLMNQTVANKRLDFEIARLKNCGELMKAGIIFKPGTEYAKVCADVMLINPPGVVAEHSHKIKTKSPISTNANALKSISIGGN